MQDHGSREGEDATPAVGQQRASLPGSNEAITTDDALRSHRDKILEYYEAHFGPSADILLCDSKSFGQHIDCYIFPATPDRPCITMATVGMSFSQMAVPEGQEHFSRAELMIYLDASWDFDAVIGMYPASLLQALARYPSRHETSLGWGHTVSGGTPLLPGSLLTEVYLARPLELGKNFDHIDLSSGEACHLLWVIPITEAELYVAIEDGKPQLEAQLEKSDYYTLDVDRACTVLTEARAERRARQRAQRRRSRQVIGRSVNQLECEGHEHRAND